MAEVGHVIHVDSTLYTTTSSTFSSPTGVDILNTELDGSSDYFVWFWAGINARDTTQRVGCRVHDGTSALANSTSEREARNAGSEALHVYNFMDRFTTPVTPVTYSLEFASLDNTTTCHINEARSLAIKLDDLQSADFFYDEDDTDRTSLSNVTWTDTASVTIGDGTSDYVVFLTTSWLIDSTSTDNINIRLEVGGVDRYFYTETGNDLNDILSVGGVTVIKAPAASTVVNVQVQAGDSPAINDQVNARIFALRLDAFEDFMAVYSDGVQATHSVVDTTAEVETVSKTTSTVATEDWCTIGGFVSSTSINNGGAMQGIMQFDDDGGGETTLCGDLTNADTQWNSSDVDQDNRIWAGIGEVPTVANGSTLRIDMDSREDADVSVSYTIDDTCLAAFTWELAPANIVIIVPKGPEF